GECAFFFQAEDGIRDFHVTGVQTCTLPILAILHQLSQADGMKTLSSVGFDDHHARSNSRRIMKVFEYLNDRYSEPISLADMARQIGRASCRERVDGPRVAGAVHTAQDQRES